MPQGKRKHDRQGRLWRVGVQQHSALPVDPSIESKQASMDCERLLVGYLHRQVDPTVAHQRISADPESTGAACGEEPPATAGWKAISRKDPLLR